MSKVFARKIDPRMSVRGQWSDSVSGGGAKVIPLPLIQTNRVEGVIPRWPADAPLSRVDVSEAVLAPLLSRIEELEGRVAHIEALAQASRTTIQLSSLSSERHRLVKPISVVLTESDGVVVADAPELELYGDAETQGEAIESLRVRVCEEYDYLIVHESTLGPALERQLRRFRDIIQRAP
jgi:hypothetical protein